MTRSWKKKKSAIKWRLSQAALKKIFRILLYPLHFAGQGIYLFGNGLIEYCRTRKAQPLLLGLPAAFVLGGSFYLLAATQSCTQTELAQKYAIAARAAVASGHWQKALLLLERCIELGNRDKDVLFDLAVASEKTGNDDRKLAILENLAPESRPSHVRAHLWKAMSILDHGSISTTQARQAELHLKHTLALDPSNLIAHAYLGELYFALDLMPAAIEHLRQSDRSNTGFRIKLAKALLRTKDEFAARGVAEEVVQAMKEEVSSDPQNIQNRLDWAEAYTILNEFAAASKILQDGLVLHDDPRFRDALSMTWILWSDELLIQTPPNYQGAFELISGAFVNTPNEGLLFDRMMKILKSESNVAPEAEEFLTQNIVSGVAPGLSHLVLGSFLFEADRSREAGLHLDQAFTLLPNGPIVANNLAWYLVQTLPTEPERALQIIEAVVSNYPKDIEYQDTRGHILVRLGRFQEAIRDLERSLTSLGSRKSTHEGLAEAYEGLGLGDLSERHRNAALLLIKN